MVNGNPSCPTPDKLYNMGKPKSREIKSAFLMGELGEFHDKFSGYSEAIPPFQESLP